MTMPDAIDAYSDQLQMSVGPFGCVLNFLVTSPEPPPQGSPPASQRVASIRTSLEHAKVVAFMLRRQVKLYESNASVNVPIPVEVLNSLHIGREDWEAFWS